MTRPNGGDQVREVRAGVLRCELDRLRREIFARDKLPWAFLGATLVALILQCRPETRERWIYNRDAIAQGAWYRLWSGHLVHFGWSHFIADAGLFLLLGRLLERHYPTVMRWSLLVMPLAISAALYRFDPAMQRYGGLSAVNFALLIFLASRGWRRDWTDWFWPAVLVIYVAEIGLELRWGHGAGGGMIRFDDPTIHVATSAHVIAAGGGALMVLSENCRRRRRGVRRGRPALCAAGDCDAPAKGRGGSESGF